MTPYLEPPRRTVNLPCVKGLERRTEVDQSPTWRHSGGSVPDGGPWKELLYKPGVAGVVVTALQTDLAPGRRVRASHK